MAENDSFLIDIDAVLRGKAGNKYKYIPKFLISYLKKIVHQDEINSFLTDCGDKEGLDFLKACVRYFEVEIEVDGEENLPDGTLNTFASNHPLGGLDGVILGYILAKRYDSKVKYLVNDLLMNLRGLRGMFVPVNKTGGQSKALSAMIDDVFASDNNVIIFPAGICSRKVNGEITDLEWKKTFITKSVQYKRNIVPIHFGGRNSDFFYNLANISKRLGIKFNIAMLYLADEMYKNRGKKYKIKIGKPIEYSTFDNSKSAREWAEYVKKIVYKL